MRNVAAAGHLVVHLVALQHLTEKINVSGGQLQRLYLAEFVRWQSGNNFAQRRKGLVQRLSPLPLPDVGQDPLILKLLVRLSAARTLFFAPFHWTRAAAAAVLTGLFAVFLLSPDTFLLSVQLLLAGHQTIHRGDRGTGALFHFFLEEMQG